MTLKAKFMGIALTLILIAIGTGVFHFESEQIRDEQKQALEVIQRHMDADMKHDGIRGNVYSALYASKIGDADLLKASQEEVVAMGADFTKLVQENLAATTTNDINAQFQKITQSVKTYEETAISITQKAGEDFEAANAMLPTFNDSFEVLEKDQGDVLDMILKWSDDLTNTSNFITNLLNAGTLITMILAVFIGFYAIKGIFVPMKELTNTMHKIAQKEYQYDVIGQSRKDELGDMARSVEVFKQNGIAVQKLESEQAALKIKVEEDKKEAMNMLANDFDSRTAGIIKSLAAAATEMQATAAQMTATSASTAHASQIVASAATEADSNVQTVAAATEELSASSSEIARQISSVAEKSTRASSEAVKTSQQVGELNSLADSIGEVIGAIKDIAEQTNLLALNATIEAARAGEAGKGFAVVADEVKKLATETASKTIQIDERVGRIQAAIRSTVEAVGRIINDVNDIDHSTATVASAVEEQNAATSEIGRNVSEASTGTQQVAQNIVDVQRSAEETGEAATNLNQAANELAEIAENLQEQVANFLTEIRES